MLLYGFKSKENIKILNCELVIQRLTEIKEFMHKIYTKKIRHRDWTQQFRVLATLVED